MHHISRCLCELAKQIGFTEKARDIFNLEGQIASYMHLVRSNIAIGIAIAFYLFEKIQISSSCLATRCG